MSILYLTHAMHVTVCECTHVAHFRWCLNVSITKFKIPFINYKFVMLLMRVWLPWKVASIYDAAVFLVMVYEFSPSLII